MNYGVCFAYLKYFPCIIIIMLTAQYRVRTMSQALF